MRRVYLIVTMVALLGGLLATRALGWATETIGNEQLSELNYTRWREIMPLINDKARIYATWVNGNEHLFFRGSAIDLNAALAAFAKVEAKHHIVVLRPGPGARRAFDGTDIRYNWSLHVLGGLAGGLAKDDGEDLEWQRDPVLTIQVSGDIDLDKLVVPDGVTFRAPSRSKRGVADADESARDADAAKKIGEFIHARSPAARPAATRPATRPGT